MTLASTASPMPPPPSPPPWLATAPVASPYPGLRAFRREDASHFFGRASERIRLLELLERAPFLAVLGSSGSGKSSLVLSGLLPDLASGKLLTDEEVKLDLVDFRPGNNPYGNASAALAAGPLGERYLDPLLIEQQLRSSREGLNQFLEREWGGEIGTKRRLVLVVDQFEEIFRFSRLAQDGCNSGRPEDERRDFAPVAGELNEAQAFVDLLLTAAGDTRKRTYVILTMRSDFYKHCEQFEGLPEAVAANQFLTPRMTRANLTAAIRMPLRSVGWSIEDETANWILNETLAEFDQLPVLQHALARMWALAQTNRGGGSTVLNNAHYSAIGRTAQALQRHGESLLFETRRRIDEIARFFRCLGEFDPVTGALIRRPRTVTQVAEEGGLEVETVMTIAEVFQRKDASFLAPPPGAKLEPHHVLDLSHECLLRKWSFLQEWMNRERVLSELFLRLKKRAEERREYRTNLSKLELNLFRREVPANLPKTWGERYGCDLKALTRFLRGQVRRRFLSKSLLVVLGLGAIGLAGWIYVPKYRDLGLAQWRQEYRARLEKEQKEDSQANLNQLAAQTDATKSIVAGQSKLAGRMAALADFARQLAASPANQRNLTNAQRAQLQELGVLDSVGGAGAAAKTDLFPVSYGPQPGGVTAVAFVRGVGGGIELLASGDDLRSYALTQPTGGQAPAPRIFEPVLSGDARLRGFRLAGKSIVCFGPGKLAFFDAGLGERPVELTTGADLSDVEADPSGKRLLIARQEGRALELYKIGSEEGLKLEREWKPTKRVWSAKFSTSGHYLALAGRGQFCELHELETGGMVDCARESMKGSTAVDVSFSPDDRWLRYPIRVG